MSSDESSPHVEFVTDESGPGDCSVDQTLRIPAEVVSPFAKLENGPFRVLKFTSVFSTQTKRKTNQTSS